jgi:hypothetical protein
VTTFVAVKVASDLRRATNFTAVLHGADLLISLELLRELMAYERGERGLNLTHSQDKDYVQVGHGLFSGYSSCSGKCVRVGSGNCGVWLV